MVKLPYIGIMSGIIGMTRKCTANIELQVYYNMLYVLKFYSADITGNDYFI